MSIESVTPAPALCMCVSKGHLHDDDTTEAQSYTCNNHLELILSVASAIIKFIYCVILAADFWLYYREEVDEAASTVCAPNNSSDASSTGNIFYNIFRFCYLVFFLIGQTDWVWRLKLSCVKQWNIFSVYYTAMHIIDNRQFYNVCVHRQCTHSTCSNMYNMNAFIPCSS